MNGDTVHVGILGAGAMGQEHAYCYSQMLGVAVVSVFSRRLEAAATAAVLVGAAPTTDAASVIADSSLDAIDICLPTPVHAEYALAALAAGKQVFCETPLTLSLGEGERLRDAARRNGRLLQVGLLMRSIASSRLVKQAVESEEHGALVGVSAYRLGSYLRGAAADHKEHYSDPTTELMTFDLDFISWLMGRPLRVSASGSELDGALGEVSALLTFEGGRSATVLASGVMPVSYPFKTGFRAVFERAAIESETVIAGDVFSGGTRLFTADGGTDPALEGNNPYQTELEQFVRCIRGEADPALLDANRALEALRLSMAVQESLRLGTPIAIEA
jgi:predicted dehydrogenase